MTALTDELQVERQTARRATKSTGPWRGKIAAPPADGSAMLYVVLPGFDKTRRFGPCRWAARGDTLPSRGDDCLVQFDDQNEPWVTVWWPS